MIATPQGLGFLDAEAVEARTGCPIRSGWRKPGEARPLPPADAIAAAPATFNTVDKRAAGISGTLALGVLCEAYGMGVPTAVLPYLHTAQAAHPAYRRSLPGFGRWGFWPAGTGPTGPRRAAARIASVGTRPWICWSPGSVKTREGRGPKTSPHRHETPAQGHTRQ